MSYGIPESDWKIFRELRPIWLQRYCTRVNQQLIKKLTDPRRTEHERYLDAYKFIHQKDKELGDAFNDFRRSTAVMQIHIINRLGVIEKQELSRFSESTRRFISEDC
jgi:hypothetical protein